MAKNIEFSIHPELLHIKEIQPIPSKLDIPDWFKKIKHTVDHPTIKGCVPVLDSITAGYILPLPQDMHIRWNVLNQDNQPDCFVRFPHSELNRQSIYNLNEDAQSHPINQVGGKDSSLGMKNGNFPVCKILKPGVIKTPPGYSCLFLPPMHRENDYFHILPGMVDTDNFGIEVNFPFIVNSGKYSTFDKVFKQGLPYVQVIPFKRQQWKMNIKAKNFFEHEKFKANYYLKLWNRYKTMIWNKKEWM